MDAQKSDYTDCKIINIHKGKGKRSSIIYAQLVDKEGQLLISVDLPYIMQALNERL